MGYLQNQARPDVPLYPNAIRALDKGLEGFIRPINEPKWKQAECFGNFLLRRLVLFVPKTINLVCELAREISEQNSFFVPFDDFGLIFSLHGKEI